MSEIFYMIPASTKALWLIGVVLLFALPIPLVLLGYSMYAADHTRFEVSQQGLRISGDMLYGRFIPATALMLEQAKVLDLSREKSYQPKYKTNGMGLPGYKSGWFKLRNGEKALMFVTDPARVVYIPTNKGYATMLSVAHPEIFLQSLRRISTAE